MKNIRYISIGSVIHIERLLSNLFHSDRCMQIYAMKINKINQNSRCIAIRDVGLIFTLYFNIEKIALDGFGTLNFEIEP